MLSELQPLYVQTQGISIQDIQYDCNLYLPSHPRTVEDYIAERHPVFHIHLTSLLDATIFTLTRPHIFQDGGGLDIFLRGLLSVVAGGDVPPEMEEHPFDLYSASRAVNASGEAFRPHGWFACGPSDLVDFQNFMKKVIADEGIFQKRTIYFPKSVIEVWKADCLSQLRADGIENVPYLSSGDVITAWIYKVRNLVCRLQMIFSEPHKNALGTNCLTGEDKRTRLTCVVNIRYATVCCMLPQL